MTEIENDLRFSEISEKSQVSRLQHFIELHFYYTIFYIFQREVKFLLQFIDLLNNEYFNDSESTELFFDYNNYSDYDSNVNFETKVLEHFK